MMTRTTPTPTLSKWLNAVSTHLDARRTERRAAPKPQRNRERERARREARQLFREYDLERTVGTVQ